MCGFTNCFIFYQCEKRHQYLCPDFEKTGTCPKRKCPYPHGSLVRKTTISNKSKLSINRRRLKLAPKIKNGKLNKSNLKQKEIEKNVNVRYYVESCDKKTENAELAEKEVGTIGLALEYLVKERPRLGSLPSFIPFDTFDAKS